LLVAVFNDFDDILAVKVKEEEEEEEEEVVAIRSEISINRLPCIGR